MGSCGVSYVRQYLRSLSSKHGANALPSTPAGSYLLVLPDAYARHWRRHRTDTAARVSGRLGWVSPTFVGIPPMAPPLCAADPQRPLHLPHVPSIIIAVSG